MGKFCYEFAESRSCKRGEQIPDCRLKIWNRERSEDRSLETEEKLKRQKGGRGGKDKTQKNPEHFRVRAF